LLDVAVDHGVVRKSGAWFTFDDDQLGQGRENAKRFLRENPEVAMQLQAKVYELVLPGDTVVDASVDPVEDGVENEEAVAGADEQTGGEE
jgi:recombination protein RecA